MPIGAIIIQPGDPAVPKVVPAYRPVLFRLSATRTDNNPVPPVIFCDVYFNDIFYKSIPATQYALLNTANSEWTFDISDACQEFLKRDLPQNGGSDIITANNYSAKAYCKFRASGYDANNFITPEDIAPVQGTGTQAPTGGTGTQSESFLVINAALQHEDNQDLLTHLQYAIANGSFDPKAYPLSHRPSPYRICKTDSDYFPFIYLDNGPFLKICLNYKLKGAGYVQTCYNIPQVCNSVVSNIRFVIQPNNDIVVSFDTTAPATDWEYQIDAGSFLSVPSNPFTIKFNQLLMYLITEAGEIPVTDQDGNIIIPQDVAVFDVDHTVTIRPRCSNGIYGTQGSNTFRISSAPSCAPALLFRFHVPRSLDDFTNKRLTFDMTLPAGRNNFQLQWRFDYGGGFVTAPMPLENYVLAGPTFTWIIPDPFKFTAGTFLFSIRTKCSDSDFSVFSPEIAVVYAPPLTNVNLVIVSITNTGDAYEVHVQLSAAVADDLDIRGYFTADGLSGFPQTFGLMVLMAHGSIDGFCTVSGAPPGGGADLTRSRIEIVRPNPTSAGERIIF